MAERKHVWVDGSLRDGAWYTHVFKRIKREHPQYSIAIFHVTASRQVRARKDEPRVGRSEGGGARVVGRG